VSQSIRELHGEDMLETIFAMNQYAFHSSPPFQNKEEWMAIVRERRGVTCHAACEDDQVASIAVSTVMTQNVRGALYSASGVWGVSTHPWARRKGLCRKAVASLLSAEREKGMAFSNLYPFRESFYERLGYVSYPLGKIAKFAPSSLSPLLKADFPGTIEQLLIGPAYATYRNYLAELRKTLHGMAFFDFGDQKAADRNQSWVALAKFDGRVEGVMLYRMQGDEPTRFNFIASRFYYHTTRARYLLLNWIARHVDQADRAEIWLAPGEIPELWMSDFQVKIESPTRAPMSRILDVAKIGGMQVGPGHFTAKISDPICPWNEGAWRFESLDGRLEVSRSGEADCELSIQGLTGLVMGTHDPEDYAFRGWGQPNTETCTIMREMFHRQIPHMHDIFRSSLSTGQLEETMDRDGFRAMLLDRNTPPEKLDIAIAIAERFEQFATKKGGLSPEIAWAFSRTLIANGENTEENLIYLTRYGYFLKNYPVFVAFIELLDGAEAQENLYKKVGDLHGDPCGL